MIWYDPDQFASYLNPRFPHVFDPFVKGLLAQTQSTVLAPSQIPTDVPIPFWQDARRGLRLYQGDALELLARARSETFEKRRHALCVATI